jgi:hypothetical protein
MDEAIEGEIDTKQFGRISVTATRNSIAEMVRLWYKTTNKLDSYVRVLMLDFSIACNLIDHHLLLEKLYMYGLPSHIVK